MFPATYGGKVASEKPRGHRQETNADLLNCPACRGGDCTKCPDKVFLILGKDPICTCKKAGHQDAITGEPRREQVQDPFTGDIHGPGAIITEQGAFQRKAETVSPFQGVLPPDNQDPPESE